MQPADFGGGFRLPSGEVCLVGPHLSGKDYVLLDAVDHKKDLGKPVKPRSYRISIVKGGCSDGVELEKMHKELYPFRERNLPRVEDGSGKRIELPATCLAFLDYKAGLLVEPNPSLLISINPQNGHYSMPMEFMKSTSSFNGFLCLASYHSKMVETIKSVDIRASENLPLRASFCLLFMFGGVRPLASVFPKPPSFKKNNTRQKALSIKLCHSLVWRQFYTNSDADISLTCTRGFFVFYHLFYEICRK